MFKAILKLCLAYVYVSTFLYLFLVGPVQQSTEQFRELLLYVLSPASWLMDVIYGPWLSSLPLDPSQQLGLLFLLALAHNLPIVIGVASLVELFRKRGMALFHLRHASSR